MKKGRFTTVLLVIIFFAGLSLLLYPTVADYWNSMHQSGTISRYSEQVANIGVDEYESILQDAKDYNAELSAKETEYALSAKEMMRYQDLLNVSGTGVMGYIEIPTIDVALPIYHGTSEGVLQIAVGHIEWTSLPVGGKSSHCVLSGHRGLPSAKLFTHLDKLIEGDVFMIRVLNEVFTYQVDRILIVEPKETEPLEIVEGQDYCTLVTCTPYGINSHRLLVRGHRIENAEEAVTVNVTSEAVRIEPQLVASVIGVPVLILLLIVVFIGSGRKKGGSKDGE